MKDLLFGMIAGLILTHAFYNMKPKTFTNDELHTWALATVDQRTTTPNGYIPACSNSDKFDNDFKNACAIIVYGAEW